jgi:hypothetical protein
MFGLHWSDVGLVDWIFLELLRCLEVVVLLARDVKGADSVGVGFILYLFDRSEIRLLLLDLDLILRKLIFFIF